MKITGGSLKRRDVVCPPGVIRPAMSIMREALFSILGDLSEDRWLDLFTGSGLVAFEALSRSALWADLVELDLGKRDVILSNISSLGLEERCAAHFKDAQHYLQEYEGQPYTVIYLDPPFAMENKEALLRAARQSAAFSLGAELVIHFPKKESLPERVEAERGALVKVKTKFYTSSQLCFYRDPSRA